MFGISFNELLIILGLALIILGPDKLPELARSLGKGLGELKRATDDVTKSIMADTGLKETAENLKKSLQVDTGMSREDLRKMFEDIEQATPRPAEPPGGMSQQAAPAAGEAAAPAKPAGTRPAAKFADDDTD